MSLPSLSLKPHLCLYLILDLNPKYISPQFVNYPDCVSPQFVAHPNCQQLLASMWYEGLSGFRRRSMLAKLALMSAIAALFPALSLAYLLFPSSKMAGHVKKPFIKFIIHCSSYFVFLCKYV